VDWLRSLKGFTGKQATKLLSLTEPFWQDESYDRSVRSRDEFQKILGYIEENPVRAGLVSRAEDFPWSSAARMPGESILGTPARA
jgi:hypothetical protein